MSSYSIDNFAPVVGEGDALDIWEADFVGIENLPSASTVQLDSTQAANLPGLADKYLGSPYLWWALLIYNGLDDPIRDVAVGLTLRIPDRDALMSYMLARRNARASQGSLLATATIVI